MHTIQGVSAKGQAYSERAAPAQPSLIEEAASTIVDRTTAIHNLCLILEHRNDRLFGVVPAAVGNAIGEDQPSSAVDALSRALDRLGGAIDRLGYEIDRQSPLG